MGLIGAVIYTFFIAKCRTHLNHGGELIFITPRSFLKSTNAQALNHRLYEEGLITHDYELGDRVILIGYSPNCAIWRWEKDRTDRDTETGGRFRHKDGQLWFGDIAEERLGDYFDIKVGAVTVSGADRIFNNNKRGCTDFVCSTTARDGSTRRMIYNRKDRSLAQHKHILLSRRIRKLDESNWWESGRKHHERAGWHIYVNCKPRHLKSFFASQITAYDGSVLALFPRHNIDANDAVEKLNANNWEGLGFVCNGRLLFTQKSLENAPEELAL